MCRTKSIGYEVILDALARSNGLTVRELCDALKAPYHIVRPMIQEIRSWPKKTIYISGWKPVGDGQPVAVYSKGSKEDAKRKPKLSNSDRAKRYRKQLKERDLRAADRYVTDKILKELAQPIFRHPQDVAFFGKPPVICPTKIIGHLHMQPMAVEQDEMEEV
ncbi:hypothetical protein BLA17378_04534 [Burkholderia aenigmatica]|uniref:Uncharacterized protein n=1 Tax=Burkholderia aenigmatica TaxID=2015348 RepID=A0ABY6XVM5_9BURK|nr:hypothetical protein [Burkholderia aenigmatica]VWC90453.1 hypothetical protein BLA17378_04534 [Burkholderia aenigmatica]